MNDGLYEELTDGVDNGKADDYDKVDLTLMPNRETWFMYVQPTQQQASDLIRKAVTQTGKKKGRSGGYGLNCVANYRYLKDLEDPIFNLMEPSNIVQQWQH